jgi:hypothetical protein
MAVEIEEVIAARPAYLCAGAGRERRASALREGRRYAPRGGAVIDFAERPARPRARARRREGEGGGAADAEPQATPRRPPSPPPWALDADAARPSACSAGEARGRRPAAREAERPGAAPRWRPAGAATDAKPPSSAALRALARRAPPPRRAAPAADDGAPCARCAEAVAAARREAGEAADAARREAGEAAAAARREREAALAARRRLEAALGRAERKRVELEEWRAVEAARLEAERAEGLRRVARDRRALEAARRAAARATAASGAADAAALEAELEEERRAAGEAAGAARLGADRLRRRAAALEARNAELAAALRRAAARAAETAAAAPPPASPPCGECIESPAAPAASPPPARGRAARPRLPAGHAVRQYSNGDVLQTNPSGVVEYWFAEAQAWQVTHPGAASGGCDANGTSSSASVEVFYLPGGRVEAHLPSGERQALLPRGCGAERALPCGARVAASAGDLCPQALMPRPRLLKGG